MKKRNEQGMQKRNEHNIEHEQKNTGLHKVGPLWGMGIKTKKKKE